MLSGAQGVIGWARCHGMPVVLLLSVPVLVGFPYSWGMSMLL